MNFQYYDSNSFSNDFIFSKELFTLINYKISTELKGYQLLSYEDNRLIIHPTRYDWAFHFRKNKGFWNKKILSSSFDYFCIENENAQRYLALKWFSTILNEELNEVINDKLLLEDSFSNRSLLIKQMLNVSKKIDILESGSKYFDKKYWFSKPNFEILGDVKFFTIS